MASGYRMRFGLAKARVSASTSDASVSSTFVLAMVGIPILAMIFLLPAPLVLPVLNVGGLAAAGAVALFAWRVAPISNQQRITVWDVSGACALIGIAAGIFSDPHAILKLQVMMAP